MSDEPKGTSGEAADWAAFQKIWAETFAKMMQTGWTLAPDSAPPEFMRQMRTGMFQALAATWDQFLRSPQFLEGMKQCMENAVAFRKMSNEFLNRVRQDTQGAAREDIDILVMAVRDLEQRLGERMDDLSARVEALQKPARGAGSRKSKAGPRLRRTGGGRNAKQRARKKRDGQ